MAYSYTNDVYTQRPRTVRRKIRVTIDSATESMDTLFLSIDTIDFTIVSGTGGAGAGATRCRITKHATKRGTVTFAGWTGDEVVDVTICGEVA